MLQWGWGSQYPPGVVMGTLGCYDGAGDPQGCWGERGPRSMCPPRHIQAPPDTHTPGSAWHGAESEVLLPQAGCRHHPPPHPATTATLHPGGSKSGPHPGNKPSRPAPTLPPPSGTCCPGGGCRGHKGTLTPPPQTNRGTPSTQGGGLAPSPPSFEPPGSGLYPPTLSWREDLGGPVGRGGGPTSDLGL